MANKDYDPKKDKRNYQSLKGVNKKMAPHRKGKSKLPLMKMKY